MLYVVSSYESYKGPRCLNTKRQRLGYPNSKEWTDRNSKTIVRSKCRKERILLKEIVSRKIYGPLQDSRNVKNMVSKGILSQRYIDLNNSGEISIPLTLKVLYSSERLHSTVTITFTINLILSTWNLKCSGRWRDSTEGYHQRSLGRIKVDFEKVF